jgi:hypothetical protein
MKHARRTCVVCGSLNLAPLVWIDLRGVPHSDPGHNVVYDYTGVIVCGACGHAQLEKFSHDCWSMDEDWDMYWWYVLNPDDVKRFRQMLDSCPNSLDPKCTCPVHEGLRHSSERVYGGVRHAYFADEKTQYCWLSLEVSEGIPSLRMDKARAAEQTA